MFERFTDELRRVIVIAQESARDRADDHIGTEHLLLGLCDQRPGTPVGDLFAAHGLDRDTVTRDLGAGVGGDARREALASVGVDLDRVRSEAESTFGPGALDNTRAAGRARRGRSFGHIPFTDEAKACLAHSLHAAQSHQRQSIEPNHLLIALVGQPRTSAAAILAAHGLDAGEVTRQLP